MEAKEQKKVVLMLENLSCPDCAMKIGAALKHSKGVFDAEVLYTTSKVRVVYDPKLTKAENFVKIIEDIGYGVKEIKHLS
ncbi:Cation transport ATPase cantaining heavy-metal-associated domain protein [Methanocella conradii HZ254]|uniref:Cation transport ATPase cantaining heavy-metal-associated domain protein n=1 Tax=Methanocella conradii (strain DSM 24694 / JCM 17849 / CGMCC 1.5162 / HZ254) TaxID=1041930 RepID=H8IAU4_METCZ|nr:cation transporter [Methanocella conradii]AFD00599.1 Cation transport ATPase cantaining heavy-metal-associated domain protein [Methanocella conradii HZ254]